MSFDLYVTSPNGRTFKSLRSPYPDRQAITRTVRTVSASEEEAVEDTAAFAERVAALPLGETLTHTKSGVSFRVEAEGWIPTFK